MYSDHPWVTKTNGGCNTDGDGLAANTGWNMCCMYMYVLYRDFGPIDCIIEDDLRIECLQ